MRRFVRLFAVVALLLAVALPAAPVHPNGSSSRSPSLGLIQPVSAATLCVNPGGTGGCYSSIQTAINAATPGDTVVVEAGTYAEQITITKSLTLAGAGSSSTIIKPASVSTNAASIGTPYYGSAGFPLDAIVYVKGASNVVVEDLTIDGSLASSSIGGCSPGFMGILYQDSSGTISRTHVTNIKLTPVLYGCQAVEAIDGESGTLAGVSATTSVVSIVGNTLDNYQKAGVACDSAGSSCTIAGNTVTGLGPVFTSAENGIRIANGATGTVTGNIVSMNTYSGRAATGIFIFEAGPGVCVAGNTLSDNDGGIFFAGSSESCPVSSNTILSSAVADMVFFSTVNIVTSNSMSSAPIGLLVEASSYPACGSAVIYVNGNTFSSSVVTPTLTDNSQCPSDPAEIIALPTPSLNSIYMSSPTDGWAVGDPLILHYDGTAWNTVAAPNFPDFPSQPSAYNLTSVSFGPPNSPISRSDGWAVGFNGTVGGTTCGVASGTCSVAIHWDGVAWRVQTAGLSTANAGPLWSVSMVSSTDLWAVGQNSVGQGVFWHWSGVPGLGGGWNLPQPPVSGPVYSVFMVSPIEGWAVGSGGAIYHYAGGFWNSVQSPVTRSLRSVFMVSGTEGWAVGDGGVIIHYTSGSWIGPVSPGTTMQNLVSLFMASSAEGWAVGLAGTILHYSGGSWTALPANLVPTSPVSVLALHSADFITARNGWIVGDGGVILHYDGTSYGTVTSPTINAFTSISFGPPLTPVNPNDGWAVGNASTTAPFEPTIYHWDGFAWTKGVAIGATNNLNSVFMLNTRDVWAVGGGPRPTASCTGPLCPTILHFTGGSWNTVTPPPGNFLLKSVFMVSSDEGWAVGEQVPSCLPAPPPGCYPTGVILHYSVSGGVGTWAIFPAPSSPVAVPGLNSVFMLNQDEGWAVGDNATILHYAVSRGVGTWNIATVSGSPTVSKDANFTSIFMLNATSGWAVGGIQAAASSSAGPVIVHWDGAEWEQVAAPSLPGGITPIGVSSGTLKCVYFTGPADGWAVGFPGQVFPEILHWDGTSWRFITLTPPPLVFTIGPIPPILTSIYMTSPSNGWVLGGPPNNAAEPIQALSAAVQLRPANLGFSTVSSVTTTVVTATVVNSTTAPTLSTNLTTYTTPYLSTTISTGNVTSKVSGGAVPGFPIESMIAGIIIGFCLVAIVRRRKTKHSAY